MTDNAIELSREECELVSGGDGAGFLGGGTRAEERGGGIMGTGT